MDIAQGERMLELMRAHLEGQQQQIAILLTECKETLEALEVLMTTGEEQGIFKLKAEEDDKGPVDQR